VEIVQVLHVVGKSYQWVHFILVLGLFLNPESMSNQQELGDKPFSRQLNSFLFLKPHWRLVDFVRTVFGDEDLCGGGRLRWEVMRSRWESVVGPVPQFELGNNLFHGLEYNQVGSGFWSQSVGGQLGKESIEGASSGPQVSVPQEEIQFWGGLSCFQEFPVEHVEFEWMRFWLRSCFRR
jgi:hypothetical protein